jgi:hypothetical protein
MKGKDSRRSNASSDIAHRPSIVMCVSQQALGGICIPHLVNLIDSDKRTLWGSEW